MNRCMKTWWEPCQRPDNLGDHKGHEAEIAKLQTKMEELARQKATSSGSHWGGDSSLYRSLALEEFERTYFFVHIYDEQSSRARPQQDGAEQL